MKIENLEAFNIEGAIRGMRFPKKGISTSTGDIISEKDLDLAMRLWDASEKDNLAHSKFLRQIFVSMDITAPLYWWSEMDTYTIGVTKNSESTMHTLLSDVESISLSNFEYDFPAESYIIYSIEAIKRIKSDNRLSQIAKKRAIKQILPSAWKQRRHWTGSYEMVRNICKQREFHPLIEWDFFRKRMRALPYSKQLIFGERDGE
ncbi:hypothetical protein [Massilibacteroides sp.]|uniref:hypothetical protein n=1 Tax=Massilibacteroides sp. TaxID=2034766 RepID=UPI00263909A6|nr:hypothetical protein [Massilibacteroides sp.]MDD4516359.1 hypothetical protein [Massilibacteroides sp.]